ncbi:MAG: hypothetical protein M3R15_31160 [Acidobacteriota bacterium]|nr:hypothetical protein [Acidobacteriota bacterium]
MKTHNGARVVQHPLTRLRGYARTGHRGEAAQAVRLERGLVGAQRRPTGVSQLAPRWLTRKPDSCLAG